MGVLRMKGVSFWVFIAFVGLSVAVVIPELEPEDLLKIALGDTEDTWFIKFYGPDCGFCKAMAEEWEAFAQQIEDEGYDIKVAAYNVHESSHQVAEVRHFFPGPLPGLHLFPPGDKKFYEFPNPRINVRAEWYLNFALFEYEEYEGIYRDPRSIYEEESPIVTIDGAKFDEYLEQNYDKPLFIYFFGPKCGWCKEKLPLWTKFAEEALERNAPFVVARLDGFSDLQVVERFTARPWPSMVFLAKGNFYRLDTDVGRAIESTDFLWNWIESGEYLNVDDEYKGVDEGFNRYLKVKAAKEKSKARKREKEKSEL